MVDSKDIFDLGADPRDELIVVLHGFRRAKERLTAVRSIIRETRPSADIFAPKLPISKHMFCFQKAESIVAEQVLTIDEMVTEREASGGTYKSITLVGHSFGAVVARKIAIVAFGEQYKDRPRPAPFEDEFDKFREKSKWADRIDRLILLAGLNRGWSVSETMNWWTSAEWSAMQLFGETMTILGWKPTIFAIRKGAPFLVQTRLQWLALMDPEIDARPNFITVQLLGTLDDLVSPDNNVDYSVDEELPRSYFYLEVGESNHDTVIDMSESPPGLPWSGFVQYLRVRMGPVVGTLATWLNSKTTSEDTDKKARERRKRRNQFRIALKNTRDDLDDKCIPREWMADNLPPESKPEVTNVVFVVHGIRDKGFWTQKIARTIKRLFAEHAAPQVPMIDENNTPRIECWTESYGYFAMLPFVLPSVRQRKVEWLMDRYVEAKARYPKADFHYVGHSNGTYLVARALCDYPAARFKHIVFAGSVVRRDYKWVEFVDKERVTKVLNYVATKDWVVALFPKALQKLHLGLGSAGHDGFDKESDCKSVHQVEYIVGGHGAGIQESNWEDIARFIVLGKPPSPNNPQFKDKQDPFIGFLGAVSFVLFPLLVAIVLSFGVFLLCSMFAAHTASGAACWAIGFFAYLLVVYLGVTRF